MLRCSSIKFMLVCVIATKSKKIGTWCFISSLWNSRRSVKLYYLRLINSKTRLIPLFTWSDDSASHLIIENRELSSQVLRLWILIKSTPRTHDNYGFMRNNTSLPMSLLLWNFMSVNTKQCDAQYPSIMTNHHLGKKLP